MTTQYFNNLEKVIRANYNNHFIDNLETYSYIPAVIPIKKRIKNFRKNYFSFLKNKNKQERHIREILKNPDYDFSFLYDKLELEQDKKDALVAIAHVILGPEKVKFCDVQKYYQKLKELNEKYCDNNKFIDNSIKLYEMNVKEMGYDLVYYSNSHDVLYTYIDQQYEKAEASIQIEKGDYIIDAGAFSGGTALYFAHKAGREGKVFAFEMVPENIELFNTNIKKNKDSDIAPIELINKALEEKSGDKFFIYQKGPASLITKEKPENIECAVTTAISIDDFVEENNIQKIDVIKMDIEGAELGALKGAIKTINKFRPKLAICIYHKCDDFETIPKFIDSLDKDYKFYFKHVGINACESVVICN